MSLRQAERAKTATAIIPRHQWGVVQRQDTWLWTTVSGFESLPPSQRKRPSSCSDGAEQRLH